MLADQVAAEVLSPASHVVPSNCILAQWRQIGSSPEHLPHLWGLCLGAKFPPQSSSPNTISLVTGFHLVVGRQTFSAKHPPLVASILLTLCTSSYKCPPWNSVISHVVYQGHISCKEITCIQSPLDLSYAQHRLAKNTTFD